AELLQARHWVAEIVYFPAETELLRRARALGCRTLAGSGMAIAQAARAFELFTGKTPDRCAMAAHFEAAA
ncbi:MAG TPA: shikimate dehydrogenase, partial [Kiloniellaceae bacterium]